MDPGSMNVKEKSEERQNRVAWKEVIFISACKQVSKPVSSLICFLR